MDFGFVLLRVSRDSVLSDNGVLKNAVILAGYSAKTLCALRWELVNRSFSRQVSERRLPFRENGLREERLKWAV